MHTDSPQLIKNILLGNYNGANFSEDKIYRYALWRVWDISKGIIMFIGLNPSTADETYNDPTIRRVISFAKQWGYGGVYMMNCFPLVSSDPKALRKFNVVSYCYHVLNINDHWLLRAAKGSKDIIFAWGNFDIVKETGRDKDLIKMFPDAKALILNKNGSPRHPLYVKSNIVPIRFKNLVE